MPPSHQQHPYSHLWYSICHTQSWSSAHIPLGFILADAKRHILGADFLHHFSLVVDVKNHQLLAGLTSLCVQGIASLELSPSPILQLRGSDNQFSALLREFLSNTQVSSMNQSMQYHITHHIQTNGPSVSARVC